jgi:hypothetical protein
MKLPQAVTTKIKPTADAMKRNRDTGNVLFPAPTLGFFIEKFLASEQFGAYAEGTRYNYRKHLDLLKARLGSGKLIDLDQEVVEVFIDPDGDEKNYIELEVNPLGAFLDLFVLTPVVPIPYESYNIPAKWAVKVDGTVQNSSDQDRGWSVELAVPLKEAVTAPNQPPKDGDRWRLNLYRIERKPKDQLIAWSPTLKPSFHTPSRFGEVTFSTRKAGD